MSTTMERRSAALAAIAAVWAGARASDEEAEGIDFKVEAGTMGSKRARQAIGPEDKNAGDAIAIEAACMANSSRGGVLVIGIDDKEAGPAGFVGAYSDAEWLRRRIWQVTTPNLTTDVEEIIDHGVRLLLVNVPRAFEFVRAGGKLRTRMNSDCVELHGDRAREFIEERRGYDWSAEPSGMRLSSATREALASARRHYEEENGSAPGSETEIARRLGVFVDDADDPELSRAGAVLLCCYEPAIDQVRLMITDAEGVPSRAGFPGKAPLLPLYDAVMAELLKEAFPADRKMLASQRTGLRSVPEVAIRESFVNALMHRDYRLDRSTIIVLATGRPCDVLKVRSPGGLPPGVDAARLIATQSKPRNPALADALRVLGLAEREGVGIDSIYRLMLRDGHPQPEIAEMDGEVVVRLNGGDPDLAVREFFEKVATVDALLREDVRVTIAITLLFTSSVLRPETLAVAAQSTVGDATAVLDRLVAAGALERLVNRSRSYRLAPDARTRLAGRIRYVRRTAIDEHLDLVEAYLDANPDISREDAVDLLDVGGTRASQILSEGERLGRLAFVGPRTGRNVRYRRPNRP